MKRYEKFVHGLVCAALALAAGAFVATAQDTPAQGTGVSASKITGTLAVSHGGTGVTTVSSNTVFAGPTSGADAAPAFRALVAADLPTVTAAAGGTGQTTYTVGDILYASGTTTLSKLAAGTSTHVLTSNGAGVAPSWQAAGGGSSAKDLFYGDGSTTTSGGTTMDGSAVVYGITPTGGNTYTATGNLLCTSLTVNSGITLNMANYILFCSVSLTNNGKIHCNANAPSGGSAAAAINGSFQTAASFAGATSTSPTGTVGSSASGGLFGAGGGGGLNNGTQAADGTNGTQSQALLAALRSGQWQFPGSSFPSAFTFGTGSTGGGKGQGDGTNMSGASGQTGGALVVAAKALAVGASGTFEAKGSSGAAAAGGTSGGGGGGGGGAVLVYFDSTSGTALSVGGNVLVTAGSGGAGSTTGGNGRSGLDGTAFLIQRQ